MKGIVEIEMPKSCERCFFHACKWSRPLWTIGENSNTKGVYCQIDPDREVFTIDFYDDDFKSKKCPIKEVDELGYYIECPYFKSERRLTITCEDTMRKYRSKEEKDSWIKNHCESDYRDCPHACKIENFYAEIEHNKLPEAEARAKLAEFKEQMTKDELVNLNREYGKRVSEMDQAIKEKNAALGVAQKKHLQVKDMQAHAESAQAKSELHEALTAYTMHQFDLDKINMNDFAQWCKKYSFAWDYGDHQVKLRIK